MIYYNHHDQIRMANPEMGWNVQSADWTKKKITALSKFKIKEGMQDQFFDGWKKGEFKKQKRKWLPRNHIRIMAFVWEW